MLLDEFLKKLRREPESVEFSETISVIEQYCVYTPAAFANGNQNNAVGENEGSCKILAFGKLQKLTAQQTLQCFGDYYRKDVLKNPAADNHQNIRQFMQHGWEQVLFETQALTER